MPAIYTRGGHALNENILLKIFAFDDSASDARTPCIAVGQLTAWMGVGCLNPASTIAAIIRGAKGTAAKLGISSGWTELLEDPLQSVAVTWCSLQ